MLQNVNTLIGYGIQARDGSIGSLKDVYFDDERHTVRYLIVDTGGWLTGRQVLIPPPGIREIDHAERTVHLHMTRHEVENSPGVDEDKPVSRQHEASIYNYWGYPVYWTGPFLWGVGAFPALGAGAVPPPVWPVNADESAGPSEVDHEHGDAHLRSAKEVTGYRIEATDGPLGHVEDLRIDDRDWSLRELVVDTRNWLPGRHVRIPIDAMDHIGWNDRTMTLKLSRGEIEAQPEVEA